MAECACASLIFYFPEAYCRGESRSLKTNATEECLAYHAENIEQTSVYGNRSLSSPDVRSFYCQPSSVAAETLAPVDKHGNSIGNASCSILHKIIESLDVC